MVDAREQSPGEQPPEAPRRRRPVLIGLLIVLFLLAITVFSALAWVQSPRGTEWLRAQLLPLIEEQLKGAVSVGRIELDLPGTIVLHDVELKDPEGERVAYIRRVMARLALAPLIGRTLAIREVEIDDPALHLLQDARGLNLMRAIEPRSPSPPTPEDTGGAGLTVRVESLRLTGGAITARIEPEAPDSGPTHEVALEGLTAKGRAVYDTADAWLETTLDLSSTLTKPLEGPLTLALSAHGALEGPLSGRVKLAAPGLELEGEGAMEAARQWNATLQKFALAPDTAKVLVPAWPLIVPLEVSAKASEQRGRLTLDTRVDAASAHATLEGVVDLRRWRAEPLELVLEGVRPDELFGRAVLPKPAAGSKAHADAVSEHGAADAPTIAQRLVRRGASTPLSATLRVEGGGLSLETVEGTVRLEVPAARMDGEQVGPIHLEARAAEGTVTVERLNAQLPGVRAQATGTLSQERVGLDGTVNLTGLQGLLRLIRLPYPARATGTLAFSVFGPTRHPGVTAEGSFSTLGWEDIEATEVDLAAQLPDVRELLRATAQLEAASLRVAERTFSPVTASLTRDGRELALDVMTQAPEPLGLRLAGRAHDGAQRLDVRALSLILGEHTWQSTGPSVLKLSPAISWQGLSLQSGAQRLALDVALEGERLDAAVDVKDFELGGLPPTLVPPELELIGRLTGQAEVKGPMARPRISAALALEDGGFQQIRGVAIQLDARSTGTRADGRVGIRAAPLAGTLDFNLPLQGFAPARRGEVDATLQLERLDVPGLLVLAQREEQATGQVEGTLKLTGTMQRAALSGTLRGRELSFEHPQTAGLPPLSATLTLATDSQHALGATLEVGGLADTLELALASDLNASQLLLDPPSTEALLATPWRLNGRVQRLPLTFIPVQGLDSATGGTASLSVEARGPLDALRADVELVVAQARLMGRPPIDARLDLHLEDTRTAFQVHAVQGGAPLLEGRGEAQIGGGALVDGRLNAKTPMNAQLLLHPVPLALLSRLALPPETATTATTWMPPAGTTVLGNPAFPEMGADTQGAVRGSVTAKLQLEGTAGDPRARAEVTLSGLGRRRRSTGSGEASWIYGRRKHALELTLKGPSGGHLEASGTATLDLSLPALRRGLEVSRTPVDATLRSEDLDLDFLSRLVPNVRELGGRLNGALSMKGPLHAPQVEGALAWSEGVLAIEGMGEYRDGELRVEGTRDRVTIETLALSSGSGNVKGAGVLQRSGGLYGIDLKATFDRFPIISDDQVMGVLSTKEVSATGRITPAMVELSRVHIPEATIELPELRRKDLQPLEPAEDVVLVRDGVPLNAAWRERLLASRRAAAEANGATSETDADDKRGFLFVAEFDAPRNLWVKGADLNIELGLSERFRVEYENQPVVMGTVSVKRGRLSVLGRNFDVQQDSLVRFTGPPKTPFISAGALWRHEPEDIDVTLAVRGQLQDLTIKATSEPPLPESEIFTLIATGRRNTSRSGGDASAGGAAASVVGGLVAGQLKNALADQLPLDVLNLEVGGQSGVQQARLEVGRYIGDKLYVGYTQRFGAVSSVRENTGTVRVEYQISPRFSLRGAFGDARQGGLDLLWSNEY